MGRSTRLFTWTAFVVFALCVPASSAAASGTYKVLSDETTYSRWAHPVETGPVYATPSFRSRRIGRLRLETPEGYPEVYLLLKAFSEPEGEEWIRIRVPGRPNGRTGWVPRERLGTFQLTHWSISVDLARHKMRISYRGRLRRAFPVGVGKPSTPTPTGHFWIVERVPIGERSNPYWPWALGTSDYSTLRDWPAEGVVGIHGPLGEEWAIPGNPSHGCIRLRTADITWLAPRVTLGTPVHVVRR